MLPRRAGHAARQGAAPPGLAAGPAGRVGAERAGPVHVPAARQRGRPVPPRLRRAALPARDHRRGAGPAPRAVAPAARRRPARPRRHVHRRRRTPAHLRQPRVAREGRHQRARSQPKADGELPHHAGDPGPRRPRARQGAGHRPGRRGRLADRLPLALARSPSRGACGRVARGGTGRACRAGARVDRRGHRAARDRHCRPRRVHGRAGRRRAEGRGHPGHLPHGQVGERRGPCRHDASHERAGVPGGRGHRRRRRALSRRQLRSRQPRPTRSPTRRICSASGACCSSLARGRGTTCTSPTAAPRARSSHRAKFKSDYPERTGCPFDPRSATAGHPCHSLDLPNFTNRPRNVSASPRRNCSWNAWLRKFRRQP